MGEVYKARDTRLDRIVATRNYSRVTDNSEVETSPAHATGPEAGIWEVQWTDSRWLALDGKQLRSSLP